MKTYFLADPHFFGKNAIKFSSRIAYMNAEDLALYVAGDLKSVSQESGDQMNQMFIDRINRKVGADDRLVFVGDVVMANSAKQARTRTEWVLSRLNCKEVIIVWGNHDGAIPQSGGEPDPLIPQNRENYREYVADLYREHYECCMFTCEDGIKVWASHYPHLTWPQASKTGLPGVARPGNVMAIHAYGHVHEKYNVIEPVLDKDTWCAVNVGVDTKHDWPLSASEMFAMTKPRRIAMTNLVNKIS
jgi:calcineurin-like phosphoesterase family protein